MISIHWFTYYTPWTMNHDLFYYQIKCLGLWWLQYPFIPFCSSRIWPVYFLFLHDVCWYLFAFFECGFGLNSFVGGWRTACTVVFDIATLTMKYYQQSGTCSNLNAVFWLIDDQFLRFHLMPQIMPRCDDGVIRVFLYFLSTELVADFVVSFSASKAVWRCWFCVLATLWLWWLYVVKS